MMPSAPRSSSRSCAAVVDRPGVHLQAGGVGAAQEPRVASPDRHLRAPGEPGGLPGGRAPETAAAAIPAGEVAMHTGRSSIRRTAASRAPENEAMQTRSNAPARPQHLGQRRDAPAVLDVDVEARIGPGAEQVGQQRDRLGAADPGRRPPPGRAARQMRPGCVGDPVQRLVVEGQQDTVGGGVDVGLQVGVAEADGVLKGPPGVLRVMARPAAVREGQRPRMSRNPCAQARPAAASAGPPTPGGGTSASAIAAAAATFSEPTRPACGM